jgi:hypothetical protein
VRFVKAPGPCKVFWELEPFIPNKHHRNAKTVHEKMRLSWLQMFQSRFQSVDVHMLRPKDSPESTEVMQAHKVYISTAFLVIFLTHKSIHGDTEEERQATAEVFRDLLKRFLPEVGTLDLEFREETVVMPFRAGTLDLLPLFSSETWKSHACRHSQMLVLFLASVVHGW